MTQTSLPSLTTAITAETIDAAWGAADAVCTASGVTVTISRSADHSHAVSTVLAEIWPQDNGASPLEANLLRALEFSGNYVSFASTIERGANARVIGACVAFFGRPEQRHLHSHIAGVVMGTEGHGVGRALKLHQRAWALEHGVAEISWTFDPLIARNANFNLSRLGTRVTAFVPDFYGPMKDQRNAGQHSDRLVATWDLLDDRVTALAAGARSVFDSARHLTGDVSEWIVFDRGIPFAAEAPTVSEVRRDRALSILRIPGDFEELRKDDPALADRWRIAVRESLARSLGSGRWRIVGFEKNVGYLLEAVS
jgi:predicted GNAT superfamily acetyltransferase